MNQLIRSRPTNFVTLVWAVEEKKSEGEKEDENGTLYEREGNRSVTNIRKTPE